MAYGRISKKQQEILDYIKNEILNRGFPPAVREICEAVHLKSTSSPQGSRQCTTRWYCSSRSADPRSREYRDLFSCSGRIHAE